MLLRCSTISRCLPHCLPANSADEALRHPYVNQFHNPEDEPNCGRIITIPINDNHKYTIAEYRDRLYQEIVKKKKELRKKIKEKEAARAARQHARQGRSSGHA